MSARRFPPPWSIEDIGAPSNSTRNGSPSWDRLQSVAPNNNPIANVTGPASNGPFAPCSLHISQKPETALARTQGDFAGRGA
jgi:hypothetical protein